MGNAVSQLSSKKSLDHVINYIAARYIRSQNFKDMKNLSNLEYCDKLVLLTSKIINKYLDESSINYLATKKGVTGEKMASDKILAINKNNLDDLDVKSNIKKRRLCIGLAKHYVQVANLFAAISSTINPTYAVKDETGETTVVGLEDRDQLSTLNRGPKIEKNNLCSNRVAVLLNHQDLKSLNEQVKSGIVKLNPDFCSFNCSTCPSIKDLGQEPGIPELEKLYYDKYDYDTGKFDGMSKEMAKLYKADVDQLYKIFTGNDSVPETVKKFNDIKLKNYYTTSGCENGEYRSSVKGKPSNSLFYEYIDNIKKMLSSTKKYHDQLLDILDKLFVFGVNPATDYKTVVINPALTDEILKELTQKTISIIANLYASCERRFSKGVEIYTTIAESQLLKTSKAQLQNLNKLDTKNISDSQSEDDMDEDQMPLIKKPDETTSELTPDETTSELTPDETTSELTPDETTSELTRDKTTSDETTSELTPDETSNTVTNNVIEIEEDEDTPSNELVDIEDYSDTTKTATPSENISIDIKDDIVSETPKTNRDKSKMKFPTAL